MKRSHHLAAAATAMILVFFGATGCSGPDEHLSAAQQPATQPRDTPEPPTVAPASEAEHVAPNQLEPADCGDIGRLHVFGDIFLASQPSVSDLEEMQQRDVKTVVDLRHQGEVTDFDEAETVAGLEMQYVRVPWNGVDELDDSIFDRTRELLNDAERPLLLHCGSGNRVGAVWVPWRVLDGGSPLEDAVAEAKTIGLKSAEYEAKARDYVERARKEEE